MRWHDTGHVSKSKTTAIFAKKNNNRGLSQKKKTVRFLALFRTLFNTLNRSSGIRLFFALFFFWEPAYSWNKLFQNGLFQNFFPTFWAYFRPKDAFFRLKFEILSRWITGNVPSSAPTRYSSDVRHDHARYEKQMHDTEKGSVAIAITKNNTKIVGTKTRL